MDFQLFDGPLDEVNEQDFIEMMGDEGFLNIIDRECNVCGDAMQLKRYLQWHDHYCLRCVNPLCRRRQSLRTGSFFAESNLSLMKQMHLLVLFVGDVSQAAAARIVNVAPNTVADFFHRCRLAYANDIQEDPIIFEDNGVYEIDEARLDHGMIQEGLFVPFERATGKVKLYRVAHRNHQELLPPINQSIPAGSLICSDELAAYAILHGPNSAYEHYSVNHSAGEYARDENIPGWGVIAIHINTMEGLWPTLRQKLHFYARNNLPTVDLMFNELMHRKSGRGLYDPFKIVN